MGNHIIILIKVVIFWKNAKLAQVFTCANFFNHNMLWSVICRKRKLRGLDAKFAQGGIFFVKKRENKINFKHFLGMKWYKFAEKN